MPTFVFEDNAASNSGVILLEVPNLAWFNDSVLSALAEMTIPDNWRGDDEDYRKYALLQANLMMATYKVLNFNPFPVGMIIAWSMETPPPGYLMCDGSEQSTTNYPELFAVLGYQYGGLDDAFFLPDMMDRVGIGTGNNYYINDSGGEEFVTLEDNQIPRHTHTDSGHYHSIPYTTNGLAVAPGELPVVVPVPLATDITGVSYASLDYFGNGDRHNNLQPYLAVNYCIYAGR